MQQRRRRRRIAIELPADQASALNKDELKRWKNRIAAARARERSQRQVQELQAAVEQLWQQNQQQKALIDHLKAVIRGLEPNNYAAMIEPHEWTLRPSSNSVNGAESNTDRPQAPHGGLPVAPLTLPPLPDHVVADVAWVLSMQSLQSSEHQQETRLE
ncbi:hypothetical protein PINS_up002684 [Pythium insidiosum]|nr:hypothetical protein PINS_up002684 [Pythium insidiosum]